MRISDWSSDVCSSDLLVGEQDFSAFRTVHCQAPHARRDLQRIAVSRDGEYVHVDVQANAFLHHMVRNIVGSLLLVGQGGQPGSWIAALLAGRDRTLAGPTAPPGGLVFVGPLYPPECGLPPAVTLHGCTRASSCSRCAVTVTHSRRPLHQPRMSRTLFRTRLTFCGLTRAGAVRLAGQLGQDQGGFIFASG